MTNTEPTVQVYTDDATAYVGMDRADESVNHSAGEYVRDMTHSNSMESFWYIWEFAERHNVRSYDTMEMMTHVFAGMVHRLTYRALVDG